MAAKMPSLASIIPAIFMFKCFQHMFATLNIVVISALLLQQIEITVLGITVLETVLFNHFIICQLIKPFADVVSFLL